MSTTLDETNEAMCLRCGCYLRVPFGLEPSEYCNSCAQELVASIKALMTVEVVVIPNDGGGTPITIERVWLDVDRVRFLLEGEV